MTIKDIAKLAGVSPSTVSRILNDTSNSFAKAETRDKVWRLVRTYGYGAEPEIQLCQRGRCPAGLLYVAHQESRG